MRYSPNTLKRLWNETAADIEDTYGLSTATNPSEFVVSSGRFERGSLSLGKVRKDSLVLNSKFRLFPSHVPSMIAKLGLQHSLPSDILCGECIEDLSFEYARLGISDGSSREEWEQLWRKHTPPRLISTVLNYSPTIAYIRLYSVAGRNGLDTIIREITHQAKNQIPLSFDDYLLYFAKRIYRFENKLDHTELKIVRHLLDNPHHSMTKLSQAIGRSNEWVSKKVKELQKRRILRKFERVPFSRVGINMYHVFLGKDSEGEDPFQLLKDCPFLYSYRRVNSGPWSSLATICIPENTESFRLFKKGIGLIRKTGYDATVHRIQSSGVSHCFDYYLTEEGKWDIPWELLSVHLRRIQLDDLASIIPRIDTPVTRCDLPLTRLDMDIIDCVRRGITSVSKIRAHLGVGQQRVADHLRALRQNGLILTTWEGHNIGLIEQVVVHSQNPEASNALAAWARRLPRGIVSFSEKGELVLIGSVPLGGGYGLASAVEELALIAEVGILSVNAYGSWGFPGSLWNERYQKWESPKKLLDAWLEDLESLGAD